MRITTSSTFLVAILLSSQIAFGTPINWTLNGTITNSRTLGNFGSPSVGSAIVGNMTVETDTLDSSPFPMDTGYFNPFLSFELLIGSSTLTLGPNASDPSYVWEANSIGSTVAGNLILQIRTILYEGTSAYQAIFLFNFADLMAFPDGRIPDSPPSLASATLRQFNIYSPVDGDPRNGNIFLAGGTIDSFTAAASVPEPTTMMLFACGLLGMGIARQTRRRS